MAASSDTLEAQGVTGATPAVGTAIATLAAPAAGWWRVKAQVSVPSTITAAEMNNAQLKLGAAVVGGVPVGAGAGPWADWEVQLDGATNVVLQTGTVVGTVAYAGIIQADPIPARALGTAPTI
jgi:hypothetical protein